MEWQPQWSSDYCEPALAAHLSPTSWAATHLSIHGLWPNYNASVHNGYTWPQFCVRDAEGENYTKCEADINAESYCYPASASAAYNETDGPWQTHALEYSWSSKSDCFSCHEWSKHGSCTNWSSVDYFARAEAMYSRLLDSGNGFSFLGQHVGDDVPLKDLHDAFEADTSGKSVAFNCVDCALSEVWTAWAADSMTLEPGDAVDYPGDDPCGSCETVKILAWTQDDGTCPPSTPGNPRPRRNKN